MDCFIAYMDTNIASLFEKILELSEGFVIKVPEPQTFPLPLIGGSFPEDEVLDNEVKKCTQFLEKNERPNRTKATIMDIIYSTYSQQLPPPRRSHKWTSLE